MNGRKQKPLLRLEEIPPVGRDGRIPLAEGKPHPIPAMMAKAKEQWRQLKARQSKTFSEAVREYKRRNGRRPPKGFDRWSVPFDVIPLTLYSADNIPSHWS